jgi:hypothetical protein
MSLVLLILNSWMTLLLSVPLTTLGTMQGIILAEMLLTCHSIIWLLLPCTLHFQGIPLLFLILPSLVHTPTLFYSSILSHSCSYACSTLVLTLGLTLALILLAHLLSRLCFVCYYFILAKKI